jgi:hypothetical protein
MMAWTERESQFEGDRRIAGRLPVDDALGLLTFGSGRPTFQ